MKHVPVPVKANEKTAFGLNRSLLFYLPVIGGLTYLVWFIIQQGKARESYRVAIPPAGPVAAGHAAAGSHVPFLLEVIYQNLNHPLSTLILQILTIIGVVRIFGLLARRLRQPTVIGEIAAGIILGPSLVGLFFPEVTAFLFPPQSLPNLQFLSQVGLILFMFIMGMELDLKLIRHKAHAAVVISHASIVLPYLLGVALAYLVYRQYAPPHISFVSFALFMGIAMSITAFPVLSRIIQERGLTKTSQGVLALTCAATDDVTAWCILAAVIAIVKSGTPVQALFVMLLAVAFVAFMLLAVRPALARLAARHARQVEQLDKAVMALVFLLLLSSAYVCEVIGIHALFGAFLAGIVLPEVPAFRHKLAGKIEDVSLVLLLPLFFVFTGLRTQIGLLNSPHLWGLCGLVVLLAVLGKFGGSALAARFVGQPWRDSLAIGALMNTRGLVELIVLNIGFDLGILTPEMFAILVLMALATTFMTGPALDLINHFYRARPGQDPGQEVRPERPGQEVQPERVLAGQAAR